MKPVDDRWSWLGSDIPDRKTCVLRHRLEHWAAERPDKVFVRFESGQAWTYQETLDNARRAAAGLSSLGVQSSDVVFVLLPNGPDFLKAWFGANFLGAAVAAPNTAMRGAVLQHMVTLSDATVGVVDSRYLDRLDELSMGKLRTIIVSGNALRSEGVKYEQVSLSACFDAADPAKVPDVTVEPWQAQFILFTSGTTGPSKGAIVTYVQMYDMFYATASGRLFEDDVYLASTPLFHVGGSRVVNGMLLLGGTVVLLTNFRTSTFWDTVRQHQATACVLIGAVARFLEDQEPGPDDANNTLRLASMSPLVREPAAFGRRFGVDVITSYGMSELSVPILSDVNPTDPDSCGRLRPGYDARIVDEHDCEVEPGESGELILRADRPWTITPGYWRMPEESAKAWSNGWFHTGDRFRRSDAGEYYFVDRQKDAIRRRGENVSSFDVEAEVLSHPDILDAAAIGVPSPLGEQDIMIVVVLRPGCAPDPEALLRFLQPRMAYYMLPRYIRYVADLPRTPSARVQKHLLRDEGVTGDAWDREAVGIVIKRDS
jgi:crotonobetaine/carnitine-CoA ligase